MRRGSRYSLAGSMWPVSRIGFRIRLLFPNVKRGYAFIEPFDRSGRRHMTEFEINTVARFAALEFILEIMLANELSLMSPDESDAFRNDVVARPGYIRRGPVDADELQKVAEATTEVLSNFVKKVASREQNIRNLRG